MPFTDAFSIANPFSVNPQYSNTPQAAQAKAAQAKANTPAAVSTPAPASEEQGSGAESLSAARTSPLMEAIGGYHEQATPEHSSLTGTETPAARSYMALAKAYGIQVTQQDINNANSPSNPSNNGVYGGGGSGLRSSGTPGTPVTTTTTPSTGVNQLPSSIQNELQSGKISSWTNPNTGQTWYAPNAIGQGNVLWVSGKNYSGPVQSSNGVEYINAGGNISQVNAPSTTTITQNGNILYQGFTANAPHIEYNANGEFTGLLNIPQTSSPAAKFTDYQTFNTPNGPVTLPTSIQDGTVVETGAWAQSANGGYSFTPSSYQFSNGSTTLTLANPTISELESYGFKKDRAAQLLQGLSGALQLSISPAGEGYSVSLTPANGATQVVNVPIPTINGTTTGGVEFGTGEYVQPPTIPIVYSYGEDGVGTPVGFQGSSGQTNTYTETINGQSYTFVIANGQITYAPTGSTAFSQLQFNASPTAQSGISLASSAAATPPAITPTQTPLQEIESFLGPNVVSPVESALASAATGLHTYVAKPSVQGVASPAGQAASQLSPASFAPEIASSASFLLANQLSHNTNPSVSIPSTLASSLLPYLNTGTQDINNFLSGVQGGINQWAATPYNAADILSTPYWQNRIGSMAQTAEQYFSNPIKSLSAIPGEMAQTSNLSNQLVKEGYAPWYFPDAVLALETAPAAVASLGGGAIAGGLPFLARAAMLTGIGAGANYGINGLLRGQWTGPQAVQNAETGGLTAAIMSPLAVGSPIESALASKGITGLAGQIISNIPTFGTWSALNAGLSSEAQGSVPTPAYLGENFGLGALVGAALPVAGSALSTAFPGLTKLFAPTLAAPSEYSTVVGVNPEGENVGVTLHPEGSGAEGSSGATDAQLLKGNSYTQITQKVYPNLISRLLGRATTTDYLIPNLPEDLIQAGSEGIGTTEALSSPLYISRDGGTTWDYLTNIKIDPQVAISKFSDALKANYNIANPEEATTETLPEIYRGMQEAAEGKGIPFEGKIYQLDDFIKAIQGRALENSNLPAIIGKDGEPLTPKEVTQLIFDLKNSPPTDFMGTMWKGIIEGNPAVMSQGTIYSQPSLFQRLLGNTQQNPQATFRILTLYLQRAAAEDSDIPAAEADIVSEDTALKLTNNMVALQKAINAYLTSGISPNMLTAGSAMPMLTAGMNDLESRLFSDLVAQGFLDPQGNQVSNTNPAPSSGGTQAGNEGYIYIQNPDGTVTIQKVVQQPNEQQNEQQLTTEEQQELEQEQSNGVQNTESEGAQVTTPAEQVQVVEPATSGVSFIAPTQSGQQETTSMQSTTPIQIAGTQEVEAQPVRTTQESLSAQEKMLAQPVRIISNQLSAQKTIPVEIQDEAEQTATTTPPPIIIAPTPTKKLIFSLPDIKQWFSPQERLLATNPYAAYASIYSPSLLPEVMPGLESLAEQEYSPMTALSTIRPLRAPSVNTPITLPPYSTPAQPTIMEENLPGTPNYNKAQSSPMPHAVSTPSYSFNEPFSNAPAATQASPIKDPALLQPVSTAANPVSFGMLPAPAPPSAYGAIANPMLQSLSRLNMNSLRLPALPNSLSTPNMLGSRAMGATSAAAPAFGFAGYSAPRIGNISLIPTAQDIMSVLGPDQMLRLLNQINPTKFSVTNIQYAPRSALAAALNSLSYSDIVLLMSRMSVPQRMMVYGLLGIPPGEALIIAESGTQGLFIPSLSNALASTTRKRIVPTPQNFALPGQPMPSALPTFNHMNLPITQSRPAQNINRQLVMI